MPKTRLISPGSIPNHKLLKNLQLQDNYLSNDGGDEGIRIDDDGKVGIGVADPSSPLEILNTSSQLKLSYDGDSFSTFAVNNASSLSITAAESGNVQLYGNNIVFGNNAGGNILAIGTTVSGAAITSSHTAGLYLNAVNNASSVLKLASSNDVLIDKDWSETTSSTQSALHVDFDITGIVASGQTLTAIGTDIDMNCESVTHVGSIIQKGIDLDMVAASDGSQINYGIEVNISGGDAATGLTIDTTADSTSNGIYIDNKDTSGNDFKNVSSADSGDYFAINTTASGSTTLTTVDNSSNAAHLKLDADGIIYLDAGDTSGTTIFKKAGTMFGTISAHHNFSELLLFENMGASEDDYFSIKVELNGATTLATVDASGAAAHLSIKADGHVEFDGCAVGFAQITETFSDDSIIGSAGTHDTHIDFRYSNKIYMLMTADVTNMNLIFPNVSGNFLLQLRYDGDHDITNWKVYESDASAADGDADVKWAGGSAPATTSGGYDIFTFYWDAVNETAFGVGSLGFAS